MYKSGFFTIIGRPNVGKSTLLNKILDQKVAIVSSKAQTTRNKISGVYNEPNVQIVFIDTPGVHKPKHKLGDFMNRTAWNSSRGIDGVLFLVPADEEFGKGDQFILDNLKRNDVPIFLVISKCDKVGSVKIRDKIIQLKDLADWDEIIPISSEKSLNITELIKTLKTKISEGPKYYPDNVVTDRPEKFIVSEIVREKILQLTEEEIPHSVAVIIEKMEQVSANVIECMATIMVERKSQKGIIIGKGGAMIKEIGKRARVDIEKILGSKVYLETFVKVKQNWRTKANDLEMLGYSKDDF